MFGRNKRRLQRENDALREALGWYAASSNWRKKGTNAKGEPRKWIKSPAAFDRGARAKFILTQLGKTCVMVDDIVYTPGTPLPLPPVPIDSRTLGAAESTTTE